MTCLRGANGYVSASQSRGTVFETNCRYIFYFIIIIIIIIIIITLLLLVVVVI